MPAIDLLTSLGWSFKSLYAETFGKLGSEGRASETQVVLTRRLTPHRTQYAELKECAV